MENRLALIGFGEAAEAFARAGGWQHGVQVFDIKTRAATTRAAMLARYASARVAACAGYDDIRCRLILSLVTADQALIAAQGVAAGLAPGTIFVDMNSVAPATKRRAAAAIETAGGRYVDAAVLAPVEPARLAVPVLVAGRHGVAGAAALAELGFTGVRVIAGEVGQAAAVKMIRSVMIKGQEALTAEMMQAADRAGVAAEVLASLGDGWHDRAPYNLERMTTHGWRRAAEMEEVAKTLEALDVLPVMTRGTIVRQREMAGPVNAGRSAR